MRRSGPAIPIEVSSTSAWRRSDQAGVLDGLVAGRPRTVFRPSIVEGRFLVEVSQEGGPWIVVVEPDADGLVLVVVTVYEVSE